MDTNDPSRPLQITHFPLIHGTESLKVAQAIKVCYLTYLTPVSSQCQWSTYSVTRSSTAIAVFISLLLLDFFSNCYEH